MIYQTFAPLLKNTDLIWLQTGDLPDFTNFENMKNKFLPLPVCNLFTEILKNSVEQIIWAYNETMHSANWEFFKEQILNESVFHIKSILDVLIKEQGMKVRVIHVPNYNSVSFPYDKFAQPDVLILPIKSTLLQYAANQGEFDIDDLDLTLSGAMVTLTLLIRIYSEIYGSSSIEEFKYRLNNTISFN